MGHACLFFLEVSVHIIVGIEPLKRKQDITNKILVFTILFMFMLIWGFKLVSLAFYTTWCIMSCIKDPNHEFLASW